MALIGYCRVSSEDQSYDGQKEKLEAAGCTIIRAEKVSGASREGRDELALILDFVREGDQIVVTRLDRLGRNVRDVLNIAHELERRGASLRVLDPPIDTSDKVVGRLMITILGVVGEMEREFIRERQAEGIRRRKRLDEGRPEHSRAYRGRPKSIDDEEIRRLKVDGLGATEIARRLGVSRMAVYRASQVRV